MKATYKEVRQLIDNTNRDYDPFTGKLEQPYMVELGYFAPSQNNWCYRLGIARGADGEQYYVVTVFGQVKGWMRIFN